MAGLLAARSAGVDGDEAEKVMGIDSEFGGARSARREREPRGADHRWHGEPNG